MTDPGVGPGADELLAGIDVADGMTVAIGGAGLQRKPMALVRALADTGVRDLVVVSYLGSLDVEFLLARGIVSEVHSAGVGLDGFGLAPAFRRARQLGTIRWVEWSEGSLLAALEAASRGLPSMPTMTDPRSDVVKSEWLKVSDDPFTGDPVVHARALRPELALLHASAADTHGHLYHDGDEGIDGTIARAAAHVLATVSTRIEPHIERVSLPRIWVDAVAVDPLGTWPTGCEPDVLIDLGAVDSWARGDASDAASLVRS